MPIILGKTLFETYETSTIKIVVKFAMNGRLIFTRHTHYFFNVFETSRVRQVYQRRYVGCNSITYFPSA